MGEVGRGASGCRVREKGILKDPHHPHTPLDNPPPLSSHFCNIHRARVHHSYSRSLASPPTQNHNSTTGRAKHLTHPQAEHSAPGSRSRKLPSSRHRTTRSSICTRKGPWLECVNTSVLLSPSSTMHCMRPDNVTQRPAYDLIIPGQWVGVCSGSVT